MSRYTKTPVSVFMGMGLDELSLWVDDVDRVIDEENKRVKGGSNG